VELILLDNEGLVADTPGFTNIGIDSIDPRQLAYLFKEMQEYICECKFNDCLHVHEPQCKVKEAIKAGSIYQSRYDSYLNFLSEVKGRN
jgi:ribosome biogenesis GTPase